jgi:hypothetical protein
MNLYSSLNTHYIRVLKHRTEADVAIRAAIVVVETLRARIGAIVEIATTFEPRIASIQKIQFNFYISIGLIEISLLMPNPLLSTDGDGTKSHHHLNLLFLFVGVIL